jgi:hypothetical protein
MRRISSLPTSEFCPRVDKIGQDVESTQSARSTVFHAYCDTGKWPDALRALPEADREEITGWHVPMPFVYKAGGDVTHALQYRSAFREIRVALDKDFHAVRIPDEVQQDEIATKHPEVMVVGHLDMAWVVNDLVIVCDIKSSIFAVKDRCESLQLHGYGMALAIFLNKPRYLTAIWDAMDGRYYVNNHAVELDSFEAEELKDRISRASEERDGGFVTGSHCSGCWKRSHCSAHLVDVPEGDFKAVLSGQATQKDVREAIVKRRSLTDLSTTVDAAIKAWVKQHGPVLSEDGKKHYRCEMRPNNPTLDKSAVARDLGLDDLGKYITRRGEHEHFDWRKRD